jgi:predicted ABC-class ATPase
MGRGRGRGRGEGGRGGRGEYYKNKYGGGGRGGGRGGGNTEGDSAPRSANGGGSYADLQRVLQRIDGKSYGVYHDLDTPPNRGWVNSEAGYTLFVERAQSDPFASPTRCRVIIDASKAGFPPSLYSNKIRSMASADYLLRALYSSCKKLGADAALQGKGWSGPKGGDLQVLEPCQHVLEQSGVRLDAKGNVIAQMTINLPAQGRNILGQAAEEILGHTLPKLVESLYYKSLQAPKLQKHVESVEDQCWLQNQLESKNLVAFIFNGAILPRMSGVDDRPMDSNTAVPFESPKRFEISFSLPNAGTTVTGMGIPKGITLICGGGFHGKSTLLEALQVGVYPKIPGDGREFCLTSLKAFKIRAEDGRNVQAVDISTFINNLPFGKDTTCFNTPDGSGSTSQAANIVEVST